MVWSMMPTNEFADICQPKSGYWIYKKIYNNKSKRLVDIDDTLTNKHVFRNGIDIAHWSIIWQILNLVSDFSSLFL